MPRLTPTQRRAARQQDTALILIETMQEKISAQNDEIGALRDNYAATQDKLEKMKAKYHSVDTLSKVLQSKGDTLLAIDFIKVVIFGGLLAWGFLLLGQGNKAGYWPIGGSVVAYSFALALQSHLAKGKRKRVK